MDVNIIHIDQHPDGSESAEVHIIDADLPRGVLVENVFVPGARCREIAAEAAGDEGRENELLLEEIFARAADIHDHALNTAQPAPQRLRQDEVRRRFGQCHFKNVASHREAGTSEEARMRPSEHMERALSQAGLRRHGPGGPARHNDHHPHQRRKDG